MFIFLIQCHIDKLTHHISSVANTFFMWKNLINLNKRQIYLGKFEIAEDSISKCCDLCGK